MKFVIEEDLNHVFVTADHHFCHENIIRYCNRPFENITEMDTALIDNWNEVVRPQDWVIHLGDFTLEGASKARELFSKLNGDICILSYPWHHDGGWIRSSLPFWPEQHQRSSEFKSMSGFNIRIWQPMVILEIPQLGRDGYPLAITLCHYPMVIWDRKHYGAWHLHGHSHGKYQYTAEDDYGNAALDVGVDCLNYHPISLGGILELMYSIGWCC